MVVLATAADASMSRGGVLMARGSHVAGRLYLQAGTGVGLCP
jgi:hypothetical protein